MAYCEIGHPDRLRCMGALLERDAANPKGVMFDLSTWAAPAPAPSPSPSPSSSMLDQLRPAWAWADKVETVPVDCNTKACALGLAAISGEFAAEGLGYEFVEDYGHGKKVYVLVPKMQSGAEGFEAAAELFGIPVTAAWYLFWPGSYATTPVGAEGEKEVVDRINAFLATGHYRRDRRDNEDEGDYED